MNYATIEQLRAGYLPAATDDDAEALEGMLERASRAIDTRTRRPIDAFAAAAEDASEQTVFGEGSPVLLVPEFLESTVESVVAEVAGTMPPGWREFRRRDAAAGVARLGLHTSTSERGGMLTPRVVWRNGAPFVVKARWGFPATPAEITEATLKLVRAWWRQGQGETSGPIGDLDAARRPVERGMPRDVLELVEPYTLADVQADAEQGLVERGQLLDADHEPELGPNFGGGWGRL